jgi:plastocyanin
LTGGLALIVLALPVLATACTPGASDNHERTVLVDYHFDQFSAVIPAFFPKQVTVRQGDTIVFKQFWNGEPHSITTGTLVDDIFNAFWPILKEGPPFPGEPPKTPAITAAVDKEMKLPHLYSNTSAGFAQNGAQPCYVESGSPSSDESKPCPQRQKPAFTGKYAYYNSGLLPYEGEQGNTFRVQIAADAAPGTHYYYCTLHGAIMSGAFTIVGKDAKIASQSEVNTQAQKEVVRYTDPASKAFVDAQAGKARVKGNLAGVETDPTVSTELTEFVPRTIKARVGEKVTWHVLATNHTVSFNVPKYLPEVVIDNDGTVHYSDQVVNPVGGPGFPQDTSGGAGGNGPPPPIHVDAGRWDGSYFLSSGLGGPSGGSGPPQDVTYGVTFTKAGTYKYACLVHPQMVGEVQIQ